MAEIVVKFEEFLELMLEVDDIELSDDEVAFLCCAAAHFGKFMNKMAKIAVALNCRLRLEFEPLPGGRDHRSGEPRTARHRQQPDQLREAPVRPKVGRLNEAKAARQPDLRWYPPGPEKSG